MATICRSNEYEDLREGLEKFSPAALESANVLQNVQTGSILFQPEDDRMLYRVEKGAICHYARWADGRHEVLEFAFPGDIIGLGHLDVHSTTAQAMVDTVVSLMSERELQDCLDIDDRLAFRHTAAVEREFDYLRDRALSQAPVTPTARVANLLLAISSMQGREGRNGKLISDDFTAGFVAERLEMSIENLSAALLHLKTHGAIKEAPGGLEIIDMTTLQRMADAA